MPNYTNTNFRRFSLLAGIQMFSFFAGVEFAREHYWSFGFYVIAVVFFCCILGEFLYRRSGSAEATAQAENDRLSNGKNPHVGSSFDDFLREEGIGDEVQELTRIDIERMERALGSRSFAGPAGAGIEEMRDAILQVATNAKIDRLFEEFLKTLPAESQQKIRESAARGESITRDAFRFAWKAASVSEAGRSSIRDDSRFLAFWVMAWMPLMCALFLFVVPHFINWGDAPITGLCALAFMYAMFAPAIYRLFIQGRRGSGRDG
jgi:hypothetical protein